MDDTGGLHSDDDDDDEEEEDEDVETNVYGYTVREHSDEIGGYDGKRASPSPGCPCAPSPG